MIFEKEGQNLPFILLPCNTSVFVSFFLFSVYYNLSTNCYLVSLPDLSLKTNTKVIESFALFLMNKYKIW